MGTTTTVRSSTEVEAGPQSIGDFTSSYRASLGQLVGYFGAKGVPREEAADLAHETIVRTLVHLKRHGRDRTDLGPLVRTIARNLLIERVRKSSPVVVPITDEIEVADDGLEPADELVATERRDAVREAIRSLSPRHRHVVGMWMEGRTPTEIARALGIKRNAVDAILHRARRSLASKLDGRGLFGLIGTAGLRVRAMVRRLSETIVGFDPGGQSASAVGGIVAVGLAAVISMYPANAEQLRSSDVSRVAMMKTTSLADTAQRAVAEQREAAERSARESVRRARTSTRTVVRTRDISPNDDVDLEIGVVEKTTEDGSPSLLAPVLGDVVQGACGVTTGMCESE